MLRPYHLTRQNFQEIKKSLLEWHVYYSVLEYDHTSMEKNHGRVQKACKKGNPACVCLHLYKKLHAYIVWYQLPGMFGL